LTLFQLLLICTERAGLFGPCGHTRALFLKGIYATNVMFSNLASTCTSPANRLTMSAITDTAKRTAQTDAIIQATTRKRG